MMDKHMTRWLKITPNVAYEFFNFGPKNIFFLGPKLKNSYQSIDSSTKDIHG